MTAREDDHLRRSGHDGFPVVHVSEIAEEETQSRWLIESLWGSGAVGFLAGHPKACKSWAGLDMAVSVASATPCLGKFPVLEPGRALIYLAEDSLAAVRTRVETIALHRGLGLGSLDLQVITTPELRLDLIDQRARLEATVQSLRPRLLLLDPLVRLHRLDENRAGDVSGLLSHLRAIQRSFDVAVILVHHTRKNEVATGPAGQGLRGSGDLWAWSDSSLFLRRIKGRLRLSMEHRAAAAPDPIWLRLIDSDEKKLHLEVVSGEVQDEEKRSLAEAIVEALREGATLSRTELREKLRVQNIRLGEMLLDLEREGRIARRSNGWCLFDARGNNGCAAGDGGLRHDPR
jgi:hypothetical protein